eukprot:symbB.v1.2.017002.t1/scaffold1286.1/size126767/4
MVQHVFCTGQPGCGKTTLVRHCAKWLQHRGYRVRGFVTDEVRKSGRRGGFDVVAMGDLKRRGTLARKATGRRRKPGTIRMGSFAVDVPSFEKVALPTLQKAPHVDVYIIDEVGRMELLSEALFSVARG